MSPYFSINLQTKKGMNYFHIRKFLLVHDEVIDPGTPHRININSADSNLND